jgi:hypothetical protein
MLPEFAELVCHLAKKNIVFGRQHDLDRMQLYAFREPDTADNMLWIDEVRPNLPR